MTQQDFIYELQRKLNGKLDPAQIQEFTEYYRNYFSEQLSEGRTEEDVIRELGSADLISRSILDASGYRDVFEQAEYEEQMQEQAVKEEKKEKFKYNLSKLKFWGILILVIVLILIVVGTVFTFLLRFMVPILLILLICMIVKDIR